ncbi:hypothetical protein SUT007_17370 [Streptococcus parasuis]|nr:hypothetical protein SUT007_17370 [Streptococcus parasuis]
MWQAESDDVSKLIQMTVLKKDGIITEEVRYFILSFKGDVQTFSQVVRGHWSVESLQ